MVMDLYQSDFSMKRLCLIMKLLPMTVWALAIHGKDNMPLIHNLNEENLSKNNCKYYETIGTFIFENNALRVIRE